MGIMTMNVEKRKTKGLEIALRLPGAEVRKKPGE